MKSKHLAEFLAASAPSHCIDGWSYLGRAISCHYVGDSDAARHLGYYAELRAAIALLAGAGVGVLNGTHFVIDASGNALELRGRGTHEMSWLALEHWASSNDAASLMGRAFTPAAVPVVDWVNNMPIGSTWQPIGRDWLLTLGLDLKFFSEDKEARNHASYQPTHLPTPCPELEAVSTASFGLDLWSLLEPSKYRAFDNIDLHFLRVTLETAFRSVRGSTPRQAPKRYLSDIETTVGATVASGADSLVRFLLRRGQSKDAELLASARRRAGYRTRDHHVQVISRAALLLRIATGATRSLMDDAGIAFEEVAFWWERIGESRGLWDEAPEPRDLPDLWADRAEALQDIRDWVDAGGQSLKDLQTECAGPLAVLGGAEIVGIWGLAA